MDTIYSNVVDIDGVGKSGEFVYFDKISNFRL